MIKLALMFVAAACSQQLSEPRETKLANGMTVLLAEDHANPLVSVVWGAHVGSANEPLDFQGNSHYLEHLLFVRGTKHYPPGRAAALVTGRGGYLNAFTWDDYTVFLLQDKKERLDELLDIQEDTMFEAAFGGQDFETEKKAVQQEYRLRMDRPMVYLIDTAGYHVYPGQTFYSRSTIGTLESVQAATVERVRKYYEDYYVPNNMTLAVVGDFDAAKLLPELEKRFGRHPAKPVAKSPYQALPFKPGVNVVETERVAEKSYLLLGLPEPRAASPDYFPMELLVAYLVEGNTALLRDELVTKRKILDSVDMNNEARRHPGGWTFAVAEAAPEKAAAGVDGILELFGKVAREGVPEDQLAMARQRLLNAHAAAKENQLGVAQALVTHDCLGDWRLFADYEKRLKEVTARDVLWVARKYLATDSLLVSAVHPKGRSPQGFADAVRASAARLAAGEAPVSSQALANGSTLLYEPRVGSPMEGFTLAARAGSRYDGDRAGLASAVAELLGRQTAVHDRFALRKLLDENGFLLSTSAGRDAAFVTLQAPAGKTRQALALLRELVEKPDLGPGAWTLVQKELVESARALLDQPEWVAQDAAYGLLFAGQPYAAPPEGRPETLEKISPADLQSFMRQRWSLDRTALAYVGPAEQNVVAEEWAKASRPRPAKPPEEKVSTLTAAPQARKTVDVPGKLTAYLVLAWPAPTFGTPEWVAYSLANQAFGGDIAGRLWKLRQDEGLAYSVWSRSAGLRDQSLALVTMGTALANKDKAMAALDRELGKLSSGFSAEDVARVKEAYVAGIDRSDSTAKARASRLASWWAAGAPPDYRAKLRKMVEGADLASVNAAAASVLKAGAYRLVVAGQQKAP